MIPKQKSEWHEGTTVRRKNILNREKLAPNLCCINKLGWQQDRKWVIDPPPRVMEIKAKINKWGIIKHKNFCTMKETISKVKRQPSEWEKIVAREATDKELI